MRERTVEAHLRKRVSDAGGMCLKFVSVTAGVPDRVVVLGGRTHLVEVKRPGGRTRPIQQVRIAQLVECGASVAVLSSIEEVDEWMENYA